MPPAFLFPRSVPTAKPHSREQSDRYRYLSEAEVETIKGMYVAGLRIDVIAGYLARPLGTVSTTVFRLRKRGQLQGRKAAANQIAGVSLTAFSVAVSDSHPWLSASGGAVIPPASFRSQTGGREVGQSAVSPPNCAPLASRLAGSF